MQSKLKKRVARIPYENYELPPSSQLGGSFVDFNEVLNQEPVKIIKRKKNEQRREKERRNDECIYV